MWGLDIHVVAKQGEAAHLKGPDARLQLVVTADDGADATRKVQYSVEPSGLLEVSASGLIKPLSNGRATVVANLQGQADTRIEVLVEEIETSQPVNFANDIVPLFTKHGCNGGGCHGKTEGQNGFRLSLLGFEPPEDYEYLVKENRGRRLFPAAPEHSLLLRKGSGELPHGGGALFDRGSWDYMAIVRWMEQGMPYGKEDDPKVESISVFPSSKIVQAGEEQQLSVMAVYSDGTLRDI